MRLLRTCALLISLTACSRSEAPEKAQAPAVAPVEKVAEVPKAAIEDTTFKLVLSGQPEYSAGQDGTVKLTLEARGGYHINQEYPISVKLKPAPGLKLAKAALERGDAAQFDEQNARFELPFSAEAGTHELTAAVDFAVCTKDTCVPDQRTLALALTVR